MGDKFSIAEVSRLTGLASHTLRYYEQQFPALLNVERSRGGHRIYRRRHLDTLTSILHLLKDEKVSIRRARELLGEPEADECLLEEHDREPAKSEDEISTLSRMLAMVLDRLDSICRNNEKRDKLLHELLEKQATGRNEDLIEQIARCRHETRETVKLCQTVIQRGFKSN
jgi:DNA-binding transcriptional MerR regulator